MASDTDFKIQAVFKKESWTEEDYRNAHRLLHELWSASVGTPDYDKKKWFELESLLVRAGRAFVGNIKM